MNQTMKALRFHGPRDLRLELVPRPAPPTAGQVRVRIEAAGICGSDLHVFQTGAYVTQVPVIMGHEFSGKVIELGPGVRDLRLGTHVVGDSRVGCRTCAACRVGLTNLCPSLGFLGEVRDGAYAEELVIESEALTPIASAVPFEVAVLAEPLAVALHALAQASLAGQADILVVGGGPIGALVLEAVLIAGQRRVHCLERSPYRRELLTRVHPENVVEEPDEGYGLVFETTGAPAVPRDLLPKVMAKTATLVMIGLYSQPVPFDFNHLVENEWTVKGCAAFADELPAAARLLEDHRRFRHVVSHQPALEDSAEVYAALLSPEKTAMKVAFRPGRVSSGRPGNTTSSLPG